MSPEFEVYAGRAWPVDEETDSLRHVAHFHSLAAARRAFSSVDFVSIPALDGRLRWRGWAPQAGMIVQIERPVAASTPFQLAS